MKEAPKSNSLLIVATRWVNGLQRGTTLGYNHHQPGGVSELADEHDLGSCAARRAGSNPAFPIDRASLP